MLREKSATDVPGVSIESMYPPKTLSGRKSQKWEISCPAKSTEIGSNRRLFGDKNDFKRFLAEFGDF